MKQIDVILPVYNEEDGIRRFHSVLGAELDALSDRYRFRIIYVLDRSTDRTFACLREIAGHDPRVTVLHLSRRFGHQMSLVAGLDYATGDATITMDADLQHPPAVIPALLEQFELGFDVVQTIRRYDQTEGLAKRVTSGMFYRLQNALSPVEIRDGMADFRLLSRKVVLVFRTALREHNQFLRGLVQWVGFRQSVVTFVSAPRVAGSTKYRLRQLLAFSLTGIVSFSKMPLRLSALAGLTSALAAAIYAIWLVIEYFQRGNFPQGYTSLIVVILFMGGLQLLCLGVLGEYLGSVFDEVKNRPLYIVDEVLSDSSRE